MGSFLAWTSLSHTESPGFALRPDHWISSEGTSFNHVHFCLKICFKSYIQNVSAHDCLKKGKERPRLYMLKNRKTKK